MRKFGRAKTLCRVRTLLICLVTLTSSSCFTMAVWGRHHETSREERARMSDPVTAIESGKWNRVKAGDKDIVFVADYDPRPWSWKRFFGRLVLTPFSVALDLITFPGQVFLFGDDPSDEGLG